MSDWMSTLGITPVGAPTSRGWIHFKCPWCKAHGEGTHRGVQLGFNPESAAFYCWRCGKHPVRPTLERLAPNASPDAVRVATALLLKKRRGRPLREDHILAPVIRSMMKWPAGILPAGEMLPAHQRYLVGRRFDPDLLQREWGLRATGPVGPRKWRILIPVVVADRIVSYTARDITDKSPMRYLACDPADEAMPIKSTLYGAHRAIGMDTVVVVEGPTSVWRLGPGAVSTWGTSYTQPQVLALGAWKRRVILFDAQPAAQAAAAKLAWDCTGLRGETVVMELEASDLLPGGKDPCDMNDDTAAAMMKELTR